MLHYEVIAGVDCKQCHKLSSKGLVLCKHKCTMAVNQPSDMDRAYVLQLTMQTLIGLDVPIHLVAIHFA